MDAISHRLALRNVRSTVEQIETLLEHRNITVFERHSDRLHLSSDEEKKLARLRDKLVGYVRPGRSTCEVSLNEVIRLTVEDPMLWRFLQPLLDHSPSKHVYEESFEIHGLWSNAIKSCDPATNFPGTRYLEDNYAALLKSIKNETYPFLAPRYLLNMLNLNQTGNELYFLVMLWRSYVERVLQSDHPEGRIEWDTLNRCFGRLPAGVIRFSFASPLTVCDLISRLVELKKEELVPSLFAVFFRKPALDSNAKTVYKQLSIDKSHFRARLTSLHYGAFLSASNPGLIKLLEARGKVPLLDTVLNGDLLWKRYCEALGEVSRYYRTGLIDSDVYNHADFLLALTDGVDPRWTFLILLVECFAAVDLYCKNAAETIIDQLPKYTKLSPKHLGYLREMNGFSNFPLFDNVPYLRRFRVKEKIYITSDHLPETYNVPFNSSDGLRDLSVDTMTLSGDSILWLSIDGSRSPLRVKNHYPVLAAVGESGVEYYVAAVVVRPVYYFAYVEDGASTITYTDECGEHHTSSQFFVLTRRYLDETTSPFTWRAFWPQKDPEYAPISESAMQDDIHLESLLHYIRESSASLYAY
ncbi:hypothetical protein SCHPADRAFT_993228 [Schizopora paradoxa]|uniref:Uncharacterized protein n=1 Tax=Schizopora paradoxa TaxID=27342 RepID=A0A0H2SAL9_9AGAM|nr:hypothetical protein SCHPADRAFT_993228 [Schizopora paradoxa]